MRNLVILAAFALAPVAAGAQAHKAAQPAPAVTPTADAKAPSKVPADKIICEREEQIGSRLGARRVCKTFAQWQEQRDVQRTDFEKVQQVVNISVEHQ